MNGNGTGGGTGNPPGAIVSSPANIQQIGHLVRYWVHYDNALAELNKQVREIRNLRRNYESQVLQGLRAANMRHPVIQIAGGRLTIGEEKHTQPLTFKAIETLLHQYHRQKPGTPDQTKDILAFLRENRTSDVSEVLKRVHTPGPQP